VQPARRLQIGKLGPPVAGIEPELAADDGEVLVRGPITDPRLTGPAGGDRGAAPLQRPLLPARRHLHAGHVAA
jgi:hypothetical protein